MATTGFAEYLEMDTNGHMQISQVKSYHTMQSSKLFGAPADRYNLRKKNTCIAAKISF